MPIPNSVEARDIAFHLHPATNAKKHLEAGPLVIERGEGIHVFDASGRKYIEALAGLWCAGLGFSDDRVADAVYKQMKTLPYYHTFAHRSHGPVVDLAEKLIAMAPVPMSKVFFTNSGSEAVDTVMKLVWYRSNAMGQPEKKKFIARERAFHGLTAAASCLTGLPGNHRGFDLVFDGVLRVTAPDHYRNALPGESESAFATRLAEELEALILAEGPETIAAFIGEPVMGGGGVIVPPMDYWPKMQAVLRKYDILTIADEVICGFGRTGTMFGSTTLGIEPDIMTLSKQLSSAYLPISAVMVNEKTVAPIIEQSGDLGILGHGFTASGHPVAAAAAVEVLRIIEEDKLVENAARSGAHLRAGLAKLADHPLVGNVRGVGLIAAVELVLDKETKTAIPGQPGALGVLVNTRLQELGVLTRAMVDTVGFSPPLIITIAEVDALLELFTQALDDVAASLAATLEPA
ncbi:aspartate aminotransferase family protein [Ancylobacter sp. A5.8]|uniref:aspartate aminotransferase family protein n=1 Tax=Ancylobacter gelatini TaxID=2919920 RepID=UPI001F4D6800|nr:aspartate aminotransferase family protein [Ancylobacter gelatini]MCJ8145300.1 aspartate aminotransferase family protein [Ancylobacter gelatini]